jgi:hypothetical protein
MVCMRPTRDPIRVIAASHEHRAEPSQQPVESAPKSRSDRPPGRGRTPMGRATGCANPSQIVHVKSSGGFHSFYHPAIAGADRPRASTRGLGADPRPARSSSSLAFPSGCLDPGQPPTGVYSPL